MLTDSEKYSCGDLLFSPNDFLFSSYDVDFSVFIASPLFAINDSRSVISNLARVFYILETEVISNLA